MNIPFVAPFIGENSRLGGGIIRHVRLPELPGIFKCYVNDKNEFTAAEYFENFAPQRPTEEQNAALKSVVAQLIKENNWDFSYRAGK